MTEEENMENEGAPVSSDTDERVLPDDNGDFAPEQEPVVLTEEQIAEMQAAIDALPKYYAVVGAPGVGKSDLAHAIAGYYDLDVVDNYAQNLAEELDIALGFSASYVPNLMVAMEREKYEHLNRKDMKRGGVTAGTLIETLGYAALQVEWQHQQITTPQQQSVIARETLASQVISLMCNDYMRYHRYFYIPVPPEIEVPGQEPKFQNIVRSLDNAIQQIGATLGVPLITVKGNLDQQMETVKETIEAAKAPATS